MTLPEIKFPLLAFSKDAVTLEHDFGNLCRCSRLGFEKGYYDGLMIVDVDGKMFTVNAARKLKVLTPSFSVRSILGFLTGNPRYQVELIFSPSSLLVNEREVKEMLSDSIRRNPHNWDSMVDFNEFEKKMAEAKSISEIFGVFCGV